MKKGLNLRMGLMGSSSPTILAVDSIENLTDAQLESLKAGDIVKESAQGFGPTGDPLNGTAYTVTNKGDDYCILVSMNNDTTFFSAEYVKSGGQWTCTYKEYDIRKHFKGWWPDLATLKAAHTAEEGDSAYVKDASPETTWSIYIFNATATSDNFWADSGTKADTTYVQTFASNQEVNEVHIVNDMITGGTEDVLSAEQGKVINGKFNKEIYGFSFTEDVGYATTSGSSLNKTITLNAPIANGETFSLYFSSELVDGAVTYYLYNSENTEVGAGSVNSGVEKTLTATDEIVKIKLYKASSKVIGTGTLTLIVKHGISDNYIKKEVQEISTQVEGISDEISDIQDDVQEINEKIDDIGGINIEEIENGTPNFHERIELEIVSGVQYNEIIELPVVLGQGKSYQMVVESTSLVTRLDIDKMYNGDAETTAYFNGSETASNSIVLFSSSIHNESLILKPATNITKINFKSGATVSATGSVFIDIILYDSVKGILQKTDVKKIDYTSAIQAKQLILDDNRGYFFGNDWRNVISFDDISYLDKRIRNVPEGKHFIFNTDSHIDYPYTPSDGETTNPLGIGYAQKETIIMKYVRDRLGIKNVIFGGDCIGGVDTKYKAAQILSSYTTEKYNAFGSDFLYCQGNHDANYPMVGNGGLSREVAIIPDTEIYKRTILFQKQYGNAVFDEPLLAAIDSLQGEDITSEYKEEVKAWAMLHYYVDDDAQKIRYIIMETGDYSNVIRSFENSVNELSSVDWVGFLQADFLCQALCDIPEGYDAVVVGHEWEDEIRYTSDYLGSGVNFPTVFAEIVSKYKQKNYVEWRYNTSISAKEIFANLFKSLCHNSGNVRRRYDFTESRGSGRIFVIGGHYHADNGLIWSPGHSVTVDNIEYISMQELDMSDPTYTDYDDSVLEIKVDRCCGVGRSSGYLPNHPTAVSYPNQAAQITYQQETDIIIGEPRLGTVNEVLFDVVTMTDDNHVVMTRFGGGGEAYDRVYPLPVISE